MARLAMGVLVLCSGFLAGRAGRVSPEQWPADVSQVTVTGTATASTDDRIVDFKDGDDPTIKAHWALLVAGSAGWGNYRHQADVFHAYQVLRAGGYREDHIVVMAYDDIANYPDNPMPGKVFNRPGGPDVYSGVKIDYRGADVTAETFLAVLEGDSSSVTNKGTGRVIESGPNDRVFLFYSDHGAAGVVGMPSGPFLYADELMKTLRKKFHRRGFKEMVMYIEACESGSMFEGLLDDNMAAYVTTAANAYESSWATYCPEFFSSAGTDSLVPSNSMYMLSSSSSKPSSSSVMMKLQPSSFRGWQLLQDAWQLVQQLLHPGSSSSSSSSHEGSRSSAAQETVSAADGAVLAALSGSSPPQFTTCLGDLYSVSWMEDAEVADLTRETLLQQYKKIKMRTSQNFTYEQGSHVMQYGALDIDKEIAGDYEGMLHNGSIPPSPIPSADWLDFEAQQQQQQYKQYKQHSSRHLLAAPSSTQHQHIREAQSQQMQKLKQHSQKRTVQQRDADLLPLLHTAQHSHCPKKRAAAAEALHRVTAHRQSVDATARSAVQQLLKHPQAGYVLMVQLGRHDAAVLPQAVQDITPGSTSSSSSSSNGLSGDVSSKYADMLLGYVPGREGQALVDDWECLRGMVQAWEGECGSLGEYGMKHTRMFANLCNAQVGPHALAGVLGNICAAE